MSSPFRNLFKSAVVLSGVNVSLALGSIFLLPIYTRYLDPSEYGLAELLLVSTTVSGIFVRQGVPSGVMRHVLYVHDDDRAVQKLVVSTAGLYLLATSLLYVAVLAPFAAEISSALFSDAAYHQLVWGGLAIVTFTTVESIAGCVLQAHYRAWGQAGVGAAGFVARAALTLYLLIVLGWGFESLVWGHVIGRAAQATVGVVLARDHVVWGFSRSEMLAMLRYSLPLVLSSASYFAMSLSDRYFLRYYGTAADIGLYSMGDRFASVLTVVAFNPLLRMWGTTFFEVAREEGAEPRFANFTTHFVAVGLVLVVATFFAAELPVQLLLDPSFHDCVRVVGVLGLGYFLLCLSDVLKIGLNITGRSKWLPVPIVCAALLNLGLNFALIPRFSYLGAAIATALAYAALALLSWAIARVAYPIPYEWGKLALAVLGALATGAGYWLTEGLDFELRMAARASLIVVYAGFLWAARVVDPLRLVAAVRR